MSSPSNPKVLADFMAVFGKAIEQFGEIYLKTYGREVEGRHLLRGLIRWAAATIASAPPEERQQLLIETISQLHTDLHAAETQALPEAVRNKRRLH